MAKEKGRYSGYDIDDWEWEFLRRNTRYCKAYRAVEWLKKRLHKRSLDKKNFDVSFSLFGIRYSFHQILDFPQLKFQGWQYDGSIAFLKNRVLQRHGSHETVLFLPDPNGSAEDYKKLRKRQGPIHTIDRAGSDPSDVWTPYLLGQHEFAVQIDTRYRQSEIVSEFRALLNDVLSKSRLQIQKYPEYLQVWDLWQKGLTDTQIAKKLWPEEYARGMGRDSHTGEKGLLMQRVYDHRHAAQQLIDNTFPTKVPLDELIKK